MNKRPLPWEPAGFHNLWNSASHKTYAVIALTSNLNSNGRVLLIEGLDMAGTQAAFEFLFKEQEMRRVLVRALKPSGDLRSFGLLLETTSLSAAASRAEIIATRFYN